MPRPKGSTNKAKKAPVTIDFDFVELGGQIFENKEGGTAIELYGNKREFESSKDCSNWLSANIADIKGALESEDSSLLHDIFALSEGEEEEEDNLSIFTSSEPAQAHKTSETQAVTDTASSSTIKNAVSSILSNSLADYYKTCIELAPGGKHRLDKLIEMQGEEYFNKEQICDYFSIDASSDIDLMLALSAKGISVEISASGYRVSYEAPSFY